MVRLCVTWNSLFLDRVLTYIYKKVVFWWTNRFFRRLEWFYLIGKIKLPKIPNNIHRHTTLHTRNNCSIALRYIISLQYCGEQSTKRFAFSFGVWLENLKKKYLIYTITRQTVERNSVFFFVKLTENSTNFNFSICVKPAIGSQYASYNFGHGWCGGWMGRQICCETY